MPSVQIKDVPESPPAVLRQRAAAAHRSLQEYLHSRLIAEASRPSWKRSSTEPAVAEAGRSRLADAAESLRGIVLVVDASVSSVALTDDAPGGAAARARLRGETSAAPELVDLEVASVLRRVSWADLLDICRVERAITDLRAIPIRGASHRPLLAR
ncbi:MAG: hypothetical protein ABI692_07015 [Terracoccus sp.]